MISTRRARIIRTAVLAALDPWRHYIGGPGRYGLYWRTYNRVRNEQERRATARLLAAEGRRHPRQHIQYEPATVLTPNTTEAGCIRCGESIFLIDATTAGLWLQDHECRAPGDTPSTE